MHSFVLVIGFNKIEYFIFPIVNMAAKYAKRNRVGKMDADLKYVPLVHMSGQYFGYKNNLR